MSDLSFHGRPAEPHTPDRPGHSGRPNRWGLIGWWGRLMALLMLLALTPLLLVFILGIQANSRGPVFFRQARVGWQGANFRMWKLRSMVPDAEARLQSALRQDPAVAAEWARYGRLDKDPRIAGPWARWSRRLSVDELPQLLNVVLGDMAFVGPRPILASQLQTVSPGLQQLRQSVLPGLTGLWQVRGRSETSLRQMLRLDALYVRRRSLGLDTWVLLRTPAAVLSTRGAY